MNEFVPYLVGVMSLIAALLVGWALLQSRKISELMRM